MKRKLNCIMLIDDNRHDNFFHERVIKKSDVTKQVIVYKKASEAIHHLNANKEDSSEYPELIFLDINMPGMNGWEFLDELKNIGNEKQVPVVIVLTTSSNPDDLQKAKIAGNVLDFRSKPLTKEVLEEVIGKHFGE